MFGSLRVFSPTNVLFLSLPAGGLDREMTRGLLAVCSHLLLLTNIFPYMTMRRVEFQSWDYLPSGEIRCNDLWCTRVNVLFSHKLIGAERFYEYLSQYSPGLYENLLR